MLTTFYAFRSAMLRGQYVPFNGVTPLLSLGSLAEATGPCNQHSGPSGDRQPKLAAAATRTYDRIGGMIRSVIIGGQPET
jgi:hypothetical protein